MKKLSRFAVETSLNCERCFWLQYKHSISLRGLPFSLNLCVDQLVKREFDKYRKLQKPHPYFKKIGLHDVVPFDHPEIEDWRDFRKGAYYKNPEKGYIFGGIVDDIWSKKDGTLIISDTKSTSKKDFNWEETLSNWDYAQGYKRQLEMYIWLFRKLGFTVSNQAVLLYFNASKNRDEFNEKLEFETHLIQIDCNDDWVEGAILHAKNLLDQEKMPTASNQCDRCNYLKKRWQLREAS